MGQEPQREIPNFIQRFLMKYGYSQKIKVIVGTITGITLFVTYLFVSGLVREISFTENELIGNRYQQSVHSILDEITLYQNTPVSDQSTLNAQRENIDTEFTNLVRLNSKYEEVLNTSAKDFQLREESTIFPQEIYNSWRQTIKQESPNFTPIINRLHTLLLYIGDSSNMAYDPEVETHYLMQSVLLSLPLEKEYISQINSLTQRIKDPAELTPEENQQLITTSSLLMSSIANTQKNIEKSIIEETNLNLSSVTKNTLEDPFQVYTASVDVLTAYISASVLNASEKEGWSSFYPFLHSNRNLEKEVFSKEKLLNLTTAAMSNNKKFRTTLTSHIDFLLNERISSIRWQKFLVLALVIIGLSTALGAGYIVMKETNRFFTEIFKSVVRFAEGELSARAPVVYDKSFASMREILNELGDRIEDLIDQLQQSGVQLTTTTTQISAAAKHQEGTVCQQEATVKEILVTAGEISSTAKAFAKTMNDVSRSAEETSSLASAGKQGIDKMEETINNMVEASKNISSKLAVLNEKAGTITSVITTITKVADQTNLLSLNASIEAEKAGENGKSFAVIAREIRRLADQTANATLDIERMISEMMSAVSEGVIGVDNFSEEIRLGVDQVSTVSEQLSSIINQVQQQTTNYEYVNKGMQAQSLGAEQINESIMQLSDAAQETTNSIRQFHTAIEQLNIASREMQTCVARMKN
ncbi:MAG: methyl-accepting chemotaxis protein [Chlamydiota bacterium]|nr:methyl-accepting chemotaxis protein [Chlamydiota bacterium]